MRTLSRLAAATSMVALSAAVVAPLAVTLVRTCHIPSSLL